MTKRNSVTDHNVADALRMPGGKEVLSVWVLAADDGVARIFRKQGKKFDLVSEFFPDAKVQTEITNKTEGRVASSGRGGVRHKYEPHMEQRHLDETLFARKISDRLDAAAEEAAFDRIVLVAAPHLLGELRSMIGKTVRDKVVAEIDKDLTKLEAPALAEALSDVLVI